MLRPAGKVWVLFSCLILLVAMLRPGCGQTQANPASRPAASPIATATANAPPRGQVVDSVTCAGDAQETYALYIPSTYSAVKKWPIIYIFDPAARGAVPVKLYKDVAEKYGFILAASNNSRNFQKDSGWHAFRALWNDTHAQWPLDPRRIYVMGFSGGARVATSIAVHFEQCAIAGVIAHSAGYPFPATDKDRFAYVSLIGDRDFNWPEIMELRRQKQEWPPPYRLWIFAGEHQWAPAEVFSEALSWFQLKAMQSGAMPRDSAFVDEQFARIQKQADTAAQSKDAIAEFEAYRSLALDFTGLRDVSEAQTKLAALGNSFELKQALKKQQSAIDQQRGMTQELSSQIAQAGTDIDIQQSMRAAIVSGMTGLKYRADHTKSEDERLITSRAFGALWVQAIEAGENQLENTRNYPAAEFYFHLVDAVSPKEPWPALLLAETAAAGGDKKRAIKEIREAIKRGLKNPDTLDRDQHLQSLRNEPEFQQIVAGLRKQRDSQK